MEMREVKSIVVPSSDAVGYAEDVLSAPPRPEAEPCRLSISRDIIVTEMLLAAVERHPRRRGWQVGRVSALLVGRRDVLRRVGMRTSRNWDEGRVSCRAAEQTGGKQTTYVER